MTKYQISLLIQKFNKMRDDFLTARSLNHVGRISGFQAIISAVLIEGSYLSSALLPASESRDIEQAIMHLTGADARQAATPLYIRMERSMGCFCTASFPIPKIIMSASSRARVGSL